MRVKHNLLNLPEGNRQNDELFRKVFEPFAPALVISDFEPFSAWWAWRNRVPFISIDHEHMLTLCELDHPARSWFSRLTAELVTNCYYVGAVAYVIVNFFKAPLRIDSAVLVPPIVRPVVTALEPQAGDHILLYSTGGMRREEVEKVLATFPDTRFLVYGFGGEGEFGNCVFKQRSTQGFLADLATAHAVVASAGFSLISECLHLKKKMLVLPVAGQYEQMVNAHYIEKLRLGISSQALDEVALARLLELACSPDEPASKDERILWPDNEQFFAILQTVLNRLGTPIDISLS